MKQKKGLLLASGGIDSPVAGIIMKKKGVNLIAIHFSNYPYSCRRGQNKTIKLIKKMGIKKLYIIPFGETVQESIAKNCTRNFQCVLCRRFMFRVSEAIAKKEKCDFLITGENLGQVASQTLHNLAVTDNAVQIPILRPLLCNEKNDTVKLAKQLGTYDISIEPGKCCNLVPKEPCTKARDNIIEKEEKKLDIKELVKNAVEKAEIKNF